MTIQMISLDPILKFARLVTGVGASLEHGDYDDLHGDWQILGEGGHSQNDCDEPSAHVK